MLTGERRASMNIALQRRRDYAGPALLSYGFRPFFLVAALWAALGVLLWLPQYYGSFALPTGLGPLDWHIHEMLFGYIGATVAGFLLTAVPNWTGRLPINGVPLAALALLWLAGRFAMALSAQIGEPAAAVIDVSFLVVLAAVIAREVIAGRNWRNLRPLVVLGVLIAGNIVFHIEVLITGFADYGVRLSIAAVVLLILLIGGRIVPSFTNNWLARNNPGRLPAPFSRFDVVCMAGGALALAAWIASPEHRVTSVLLLAAGVLHVVRLIRWAGDRTLRDRLVLVLHVAYAFVPAGFLLLGLSAWWSAVPQSAGIHAFTAGAMGLMPLAVMTRATLGHTGQPLAASAGTQAIYALAASGALLRIAAALAGSTALLDLGGLLWIAAFAGFAVLYGPLLIGRPPNWHGARHTA
jgi:uncharacterized protein involved in response to NO